MCKTLATKFTGDIIRKGATIKVGVRWTNPIILKNLSMDTSTQSSKIQLCLQKKSEKKLKFSLKISFENYH